MLAEQQTQSTNRRHTKWFTAHANVRTPECICSECGNLIEEFFPVYIVYEKYEARFHQKCYFNNHWGLRLPRDEK